MPSCTVTFRLSKDSVINRDPVHSEVGCHKRFHRGHVIALELLGFLYISTGIREKKHNFVERYLFL